MTTGDDRVVAGRPDGERMRRMLAARRPVGRTDSPQEIADFILFPTPDGVGFRTGTIPLVEGSMVVQ